MSRIEKFVLATEQGQTIGAAVRQSDVNAALLIRTEIKYCAVTFCAAPNTEPQTIDEGANTVLAHYQHLNVSEIREAFRLASIGVIEVNLAAYHGQFSVRILGSVLSAYDDYRAAAARAVRAKIREQQDAKENELRAGALREKFGTIADQYNALRIENSKYARWQDLPGWFCRRVVEEDVPNLCIDEKGATWITAKAWAVNQIGMLIMDQLTPADDKARYLRARQAAAKDPDIFPDEMRKEAEDAYCKMLVFSKIAPYAEK